MTTTDISTNASSDAPASVPAGVSGRAVPEGASGAVGGAPRLWLRLEGAAVLLLALLVFARGGHSWALLALLFFVPDLSFAGYLAGPRVGATVYNLAHSYAGPAALAAWALLTGRPPVAATIWIAHIGFDRMLGYGLKYPTAFSDTHLGCIGRRASP